MELGLGIRLLDGGLGFENGVGNWGFGLGIGIGIGIGIEDWDLRWGLEGYRIGDWD